MQSELTKKTFIEKMEAQLADADGLEVRARVDAIYDRVVNAILATAQQIAKMDRGDALATEDKGQINYYVIMIGKLGDAQYRCVSRC